RGGVQCGVEEGVGGNVFLVEEASLVGGAGGVVDADVLGDFAGGAGEVAHHAVGEDDEAFGEQAAEGVVGEKGGKGRLEIGVGRSGTGEGIIFENDGFSEGERAVGREEGVAVGQAGNDL